MPRRSPRSLSELATHQIQRWERERTLRDEPNPGPCVAISRLPSAGASAVGQRVADQLGLGFFGLEIVDAIARERGIRSDLVASVDEHVRPALYRWLTDGVQPTPFGEREYHEALLRTLATLSAGGSAVILGRGSPYVLPQERTLRVFVVASREFREARLANLEGISVESAARQLERAESERRAFLNHHFGVDPDDASLYDLVVNTETWGIEGAANVVARALRDRFRDAPAPTRRSEGQAQTPRPSVYAD